MLSKRDSSWAKRPSTELLMQEHWLNKLKEGHLQKTEASPNTDHLVTGIPQHTSTN